jgi:hypothetical protein
VKYRARIHHDKFQEMMLGGRKEEIRPPLVHHGVREAGYYVGWRYFPKKFSHHDSPPGRNMGKQPRNMKRNNVTSIFFEPCECMRKGAYFC